MADEQMVKVNVTTPFQRGNVYYKPGINELPLKTAQYHEKKKNLRIIGDGSSISNSGEGSLTFDQDSPLSRRLQGAVAEIVRGLGLSREDGELDIDVIERVASGVHYGKIVMNTDESTPNKGFQDFLRSNLPAQVAEDIINSGYDNLADLKEADDTALSSIKSVGTDLIPEIRAAVNAYGQSVGA